MDTGEKITPLSRQQLRYSGVDDHAMITKIHDVIANTKVTLRNFSYENKDGMFEGLIQLLVPNTNTLKGLIKSYRALME